MRSLLSSGYGLSLRSKRKPHRSVFGMSIRGRRLSVGILSVSGNLDKKRKRAIEEEEKEAGQ